MRDGGQAESSQTGNKLSGLSLASNHRTRKTACSCEERYEVLGLFCQALLMQLLTGTENSNSCCYRRLYSPLTLVAPTGLSFNRLPRQKSCSRGIPSNGAGESPNPCNTFTRGQFSNYKLFAADQMSPRISYGDAPQQDALALMEGAREF